VQPAAILSVIFQAQGADQVINKARQVNTALKKVDSDVVINLRAEVDNKGFEDFAVKKMIAREDVVTKLRAEVEDKGFEEGGIKKAIFRDDAVTTLRAKLDDVGFEDGAVKKAIFESDAVTHLRADLEDLGFEEGAIKKHIFESDATTTLRARVDEAGFAEFLAEDKAVRTAAARPITQNIRFNIQGAGRAAASEAAAAGASSSSGGGSGSMLGSALAGSIWGSHSSGGRRMPGWLGYLGGMGAAGAGFGSLGSFAGFGSEHILLTGAGIVGSGLTAGVGGGGVLAAGALGTLAVGAGSDLLASAKVLSQAKELHEMKKKAVEDEERLGKYSKVTEKANRELNEVMKERGPLAKIELEVAEKASNVATKFNKAAEPAQKHSANIDKQVLSVGETFAPIAGHAADQNLAIIERQLKPLFTWLKGPEGIGIFNTLEDKFKEDLPHSVHALTQAVEFFLKTMAVASQYTGGFTKDLDKFFTKYNSAQGFKIWEQEIGRLVADWKTWAAFVKILAQDLEGFFSQDTHTGKGIIVVLTGMLEKLHEWEVSTKGSGEIHNLFQVHKEEVVALLRVLPEFIKSIGSIYLTVSPLFVEAMTGAIKVLAAFLAKMEELSPATKYIIGFLIIAAKLKLLGPMFSLLKGWFTAAFSTAATEAEDGAAAVTASNDAIIASNAEVIASLQALAAMYAEVHGVQVASAETSAVSGAESSVGSAASAGTSVAGRAGMLRGGVIAAGATYAVGNVATSVANKDYRDAGFEAGGALVGGIAGALVGGPVGAALGAAAGSLGGEIISGLFKHTTKHPFEEMIKSEIQHSKSVEGQLERSLSGLEKAEDNLKHDRVGNNKTTNAVKDAQKHLNEVVEKYGPISHEAHAAEEELAEARKANKEATQAWASAQRLSGTEQELAIERAKEVINTDKPLIENMQLKVKRLREEQEENGRTTESLEKISKAEGEVVGTQEKLHGAFKVLKNLAPGLNKEYHEMTNAQHKWGKDYIALVPEMENKTQGFQTHTEQVLGRAQASFGAFHGGVKNYSEGVEMSLTNMEENGVGNIEGLMGALNNSLKGMGISPINFKGHKNKLAQHQGHTQKKAMGGMLVPGSGSGDTVPLTAMVEPGEVVHVLNKNAVSKLNQLEKINKSVPRFAKGGAMGSNGELILTSAAEGNITQGKEPQIMSDLRKFSAEMREAVYVISAYRTPQHSVEVGGFADDPHTRGEAADIGLGAPTLASMEKVAEKQLEATGLYRPFVSDPAEINHVQLLAGGPQGEIISSAAGGATTSAAVAAAVKKIAGTEVTGPAGKLKELDQKAINTATKAANEYLVKNAPSGGGSFGGNFTEIAGNNAVEAAGKTLLANGLNKIGASGILGNAWQESSWDPGAVGSGGGGMLGFTAGEISWAALQEAAAKAGKNYESAAFQMTFALEHISSSIISGLNSSKTPAAAAQFFMEEWERPLVATENLPRRIEGAEKAYSMGLAKGGTIHPEKAIAEIAKQSKSKNAKEQVKASKAIPPVLTAIEGIGLKGTGQLSKLAEQTNNAEKYGEYAANAESLDHTEVAKRKEIEKLEKEGRPTEWLVQGKFNGKVDTAWLEEKLGSLMSLRNELIGTHGSISQKTDFTHKLYHSTHSRLENTIRKILKDEEQKRHLEKEVKQFEKEVEEIEREIKTIEQAKNNNIKGLEKEQKELEHQLSKAENAPKQTQAVHNEIVGLRGQIQDKQHAINNTNGVGNESTKALHKKINEEINPKIRKRKEHITQIGGDENRLHNVESNLEQILPTIKSQEEGLRTTATDIFTGGGSVGSESFWGLQTVQGKGGPTNQRTKAFKQNEIGGEIFSVLNQLSGIETELHPVIEPPEPESVGDQKLKEIEASLALAELTPGEEDNIAALTAERNLDIERLNEAKGENNFEAITQWANALKSTEEALGNGSIAGQQEAIKEEHTRDVEEINEQLRKNMQTLSAESPVMQGMPTVQQIAYAGGFARGGLVAATVGETGPEVAFLPNNSRVISHPEAVNALRGSGKSDVNFEEIHFHEDGRVHGRMNGEDFDGRVEKVNRKQATRAATGRTPGGRTR